MAEPVAHMEIMAPPGMEEMTEQIKTMFSGMGNGKKKARKLKIKEAFRLLVDEEAAKMVNEEELKQKRSETSSRTASYSSMKSIRLHRARKPVVPKCHAPVCSAICCRWWKAPRSTPNTA
jgi:ATP-dependent HslUV protease ATP-binding subunit HslU